MRKTLTLACRALPVLFFGFFASVAFLPESKAYEDEVKPSLEIFSGYKPMYFLLGTEHSKFEISFKAKIVESLPVYFAYTQISGWDIFKNSAPFTDTSYSPDLFYRHALSDSSWLDYGLLHESNGKTGDDSRAWNRVYVRYESTEHFSKSNLAWSAQAWAFVVEPDRSRDLPKYRGIYELTATWSDFLGEAFDRDDLTLRLYPGGGAWINPFLGGQELTLRLKSKARKFLPLFVFQVFHGYGESLLELDDNHWIARAGIGF